MIKMKNIKTCFFDVDNTLVKTYVNERPEGSILVPSWSAVSIVAIKQHVDAIKSFKARGMNIVVWSKGGSDWAETVIKLLDLTDYVDLIVNKPDWAFDDMPANKILTDVIYFNEKSQEIELPGIKNDEVERIMNE